MEKVILKTKYIIYLLIVFMTLLDASRRFVTLFSETRFYMLLFFKSRELTRISDYKIYPVKRKRQSKLFEINVETYKFTYLCNISISIYNRNEFKI